MTIVCDFMKNHTIEGEDGAGAECPICGKTEVSHFVRSDERDVVKCANCGLLFSWPRPSGADISRFFSSEYIRDEQRVTTGFTTRRASALQQEADVVREYLPDGGRLLDVGAASGVFLSSFVRDAKWRVEGVEPSLAAAQYAGRIYGITVHVGFLRDQKLPGRGFDAVTSLDTFYFHPEPNEDLEEIARLLRCGGYLFIEIPGLNFRLFKNTGVVCRLVYKKRAQLNARLHLFFYSPVTLCKIVRRHGFELVARYPQEGPSYGSLLARLVRRLYFRATSVAYLLSKGAVNFVPKELFVFRRTG